MRRVPEGDVGNLLEKSGEELARAMGLGEKASRALVELRRGFDAGAVVERLAREGFRAVTYSEEAYPSHLKLAPDPPPALFVGGDLGGGATVALVGSRRATRSGLETAAVLGRALAARGGRVVSGLAAGVDAAAHEALASLLDRLHRELAVTILYVSHEFGAVEHFVERLVLVRGGIVFDGPPSRLPEVWHDPSHVH
jgi:DNA processing protein